MSLREHTLVQWKENDETLRYKQKLLTNITQGHIWKSPSKINLKNPKDLNLLVKERVKTLQKSVIKKVIERLIKTEEEDPEGITYLTKYITTGYLGNLTKVIKRKQKEKQGDWFTKNYWTDSNN